MFLCYIWLGIVLVNFSKSYDLFFFFYINTQFSLLWFVGIYFKVSGYGKCGWTKLLGRDSITQSSVTSTSTSITGATTTYTLGGVKDKDRSIQFSGSEEYISSIVYIIGAKNGKHIKK